MTIKDVIEALRTSRDAVAVHRWDYADSSELRRLLDEVLSKNADAIDALSERAEFDRAKEVIK